MQYVLPEEQESFRTSLRRFLEAHSSEEDVRHVMETDEGYDHDLWVRMASELGLQGIHVPERFGGVGLGQRELAMAMEELGRVLYVGPYLSTVVLSVNALLASGDEEACAAYLPPIVRGELRAAVAFVEADGDWDFQQIGLQAREDGDGRRFRLEGTKDFVVDGHTADLILVLASGQDGSSLFAVSMDHLDDGAVDREVLPTLDRTRKQARLRFHGAPARRVGTAGRGAEVMREVCQLTAVALSAEQVGGAQRCLDMAVDYARQRIQFGRPIGSFQAIKHTCARMSLGVEAARSAALFAAWCADERRDALSVEASVAKAYCSDTFTRAAAENLQIHGGIGFTWEHPAHLYLRRAKASELFLGDGRHHRERVLHDVGLSRTEPVGAR